MCDISDTSQEIHWHISYTFAPNLSSLRNKNKCFDKPDEEE